MAKTKFRPLHDRVVVKRIDAEEKSKGGIIIPDTAKEKPSQGEVIAVGPGGRDETGKIIKPDVIGVQINQWSELKWLPKKSALPATRGTKCCAASTSWPMP